VATSTVTYLFAISNNIPTTETKANRLTKVLTAEDLGGVAIVSL